MDALQIADLKTIIVKQFRLTSGLGSVDSHSFFDISNVFPIGGEYRDSSLVTVRGPARKTMIAGNSENGT